MLGPKSHYCLEVIPIICTIHPSTHVLVQPINIYWATSLVLGTVLGAGDIAGGKTDEVLALMELTFWWQKIIQGSLLGLWAFFHFDLLL